MTNIAWNESNFFVHAVTQVNIGRFSQTLDWYVGGFYDDVDAKSFQVELRGDWEFVWPEEGNVLQPILPVPDSNYFVTYACMISDIEEMCLFSVERLRQQGYRIIPPYQSFDLINHVKEAGRTLARIKQLSQH